MSDQPMGVARSILALVQEVAETKYRSVDDALRLLTEAVDVKCTRLNEELRLTTNALSAANARITELEQAFEARGENLRALCNEAVAYHMAEIFTLRDNDTFREELEDFVDSRIDLKQDEGDEDLKYKIEELLGGATLHVRL